MSYVDAGYTVGLSVLFLYGVGLVMRRRRLERAVDLTADDPLLPSEPGAPSRP